VARVVGGQRQGVNQRDAGDLQVEIGEGRAGPPEVVFQFAVAAGCVCVKWQDCDDLKEAQSTRAKFSAKRSDRCAPKISSPTVTAVIKSEVFGVTRSCHFSRPRKMATQ